MEKENFGIKLNALKYKNAGVASLKGSTATKKCLVIPIEDNNLFVSANADGTPKAVYLDLRAFALRESKYDQTHLVKQSLPKEVREKMSKEELDAMPILGGMKAFESVSNNAADACNAPMVGVGSVDDLPF